MKKSTSNLKMGILVALCMMVAKGHSQTHSTPAGGNWNDTLTWTNHIVPTAGDDVVINGPVNVTSCDCNNITITESGILQNNDAINHSITIHGNTLNEGILRDNPSGHVMLLYAKGNIVNNGEWKHKATTLTGAGQQSLTFNQEFAGLILQSENTSNTIVSTTDLTFNTTMVDFDNDMLVLPEGSQLKLTNGGEIKEIDIDANNSTITMDTNCILYYASVSDCILGEFVMLGDGVIFHNSVIVNGTLQNHPAAPRHVSVNGDITNYGTIKNNPDGWVIILDISGNIINNGVWDNNFNNLTGDAETQYITLNNVFEGDFLQNTKTAGTVVALTDLHFNTTSIDMNYRPFVLPAESQLTLTNTGYFRRMELEASNSSIWMDGTGYLEEVAIQDCILKGTVTVRYSVEFEGSLTIEDTLQNNSTGPMTVVVNGDIHNKGVIRNNPAGWVLVMDITGDITNNGLWNSNFTTLTGTSDQNIFLVDDKPIEALVQFAAMTGTSGFEWFFQGASLIGNPDFSNTNWDPLRFNVPVSPVWYGNFNCSTNEGWSRYITVGKALIPAANFEATLNCTDVGLTWDMQPGGNPDSWNVYRDDEFLANSTSMFYTDELLMPGEEFSYHVTAVYGEKESAPTEIQTVYIETPPDLMPENFSVMVVADTVELTWTMPGGCLIPDGYKVYRNGIAMNTGLITDLESSDNPGSGDYNYSVRAVYYFGESEPTDVQSVHISGIAERNIAIINIFPNPVSEKLFIESASPVISYRIYSCNGLHVLSGVLKGNGMAIDVTGLKSGIYFIHFHTGNRTGQARFVVGNH